MKIIKRYYIDHNSLKSFPTLQEAEYYVYTQECLSNGWVPDELGKWLLDHYKMTPTSTYVDSDNED